MSDHQKVFNIATDLEDISIEMEQLTNLIILYFEHREDEMGGIDPEQPWTVQIALSRADLGLALLNAIETKTYSISAALKKAEEEACTLSRSMKTVRHDADT